MQFKEMVAKVLGKHNFHMGENWSLYLHLVNFLVYDMYQLFY